MEYVIVEFPERREVFVDGQSQGDNRDDDDAYRILMVGEGLHTFRLGGATDCAPLVHSVKVAKTSSVVPLRVVFTKVS